MQPLEECMPQFLRELDSLETAPNVSVLIPAAQDRSRSSYLGGHCLAAIVGASKYAGPLDIYLQKVEGIVAELNAPMEWGLRLEDVVAQKYSDVSGHPLTRIKTVFHPKYPFLGGSPDFLAADNPSLMIEIKTAAEEMLYQTDENGYPQWGDPGTEEIPQGYFVQVQYYMGLIGRTRTELAVFFLGAKREFRIYEIKFDQELYNLLVEKGVEFWETYVKTKTPPPVDTHPSDAVKLYLAGKALESGSVLEIPNHLAPIAIELEYKSELRLKLEGEEDALKAHLLESMAKIGCKKLHGELDGIKYSIGIQGGKGDPGKPYTEWKDVTDKLVKLLGNEEVTNKIIADCTYNPKSKNPYIRGYFQSIRNARKRKQANTIQKEIA
jgi:putative phage-type endonuclease